MVDDETIRIAVFAIIMVFAIPLHEFGHALAADFCGDDVPALQGRVTMEPWAHWDLLGSILMALAIFFQLPLIGWGKPILTDPTHYRNGKWGRLLVASAGILVNLLLATIGAVVFRVMHLGQHSYSGSILDMFVLVNLSLAFFNLLPIPPLDGSKILFWFLPTNAAIKLEQRVQPISFLLLYALVFLAPQVVDIRVPANWMCQHFLGLS